MKLVRTTRLQSPQRVFEVDLCRVGEEQGVVNFRSGRIGEVLREGSQTVHPVPFATAEALYDKLVQEKLDAGYAKDGEDGAPDGAADSASVPTPADPGAEARAARIMQVLAQGGTPDWPLSRVAWRAGELRLVHAAPLLLKAARSGGQLGYSATWALARCGNPVAIDTLRGLARDGATEPIRRMATEGLRVLLSGPDRDALFQGFAASLPAAVAEARIQGADATVQALTGLIERDRSAWAGLYSLYLLDTEADRAVLRSMLRTMRLGPGAMLAFRRIHKASELRGDGEMFGLCGRLVATCRPFISMSRWYGWGYVPDAGYINVREEITTANPRVAWLKGTRRWYRRRMWRHLRRLGELGTEEYVPMAAGLLAAFSDEDLPAETTRTMYTYGGSERYLAGGLLSVWAVANVLHGWDERAQSSGRTLSFYLDEGSWEGRSEPFSNLWDRRLDAVIHLLESSRAARVHGVMSGILRAHPTRWHEVPTASVIRWLASPYEGTRSLACDLAKERFDLANPDFDLLVGLANTEVDRGRSLAHRWMEALLPRLVQQAEIVARIALSAQADTRDRLRDLLSGFPTGAAAEAALVEVLLAAVEGLDEVDEEAVRSIATLLVTAFPRTARGLPLERIARLLEHASAAVQECAARLLLGHDVPAAELPGPILARVMSSEHPSIRGIGMRLFAALPEAQLLARQEQILSLAASPHEDVRRAVQPVVGRLAAAHPSFAEAALTVVVARLTSPADEGVHEDLLSLARAHLPLSRLSPGVICDLLLSPHEVAWELVGDALPQAPADGFEMARLVELADHRWLAIRKASRAHIEARRAELPDALPQVVHPLVDAEWDDSRAWAFGFLGSFEAEHWTPDLLIEVCDSVRPDVQAFGRRLITRFFEEADGPRYLLRLAQHPTPNMQLFASSYLERYAADDVERLEALELFFVTVLCGVNRGRVAKARVFALLQTEAERSEAHARVVARILGPVSATHGVQDRARAVQGLLAIALRWPEIDIPLSVMAPGSRGSHAV